MDDPRRLEAKQLARAKVRSKRRRVAIIRRRTMRASIALFAILWAVICGRLVAGNDPALSKISKSASAAASPRSQPGEPVPRTEFAPEAEPEVPETGGEFEEPLAEIEEPEVEFVETEPEPIITASS